MKKGTRRRLQVPDQFVIPVTWGRSYAALAVNTPAAPYSFASAGELVRDFLDPILANVARGTWDPLSGAWSWASATRHDSGQDSAGVSWRDGVGADCLTATKVS